MSRAAPRRLLSHLFSLLAAALFPTRPFSLKETKLFGLRMLLYIDQRTCQRIYFGLFERAETRFLLKQVRPSDVCLDIGANVGYYSFLFATLAHEVIAVEPIRVNTDLMRLTASLNSIHNIRIICAAVGGAKGELEFIEDSQTGYSTVKFSSSENQLREVALSPAYTVPSISIDDLDLARLSIVKIDVEGYELTCLRGMLKTLKNLQPRLLMIELVEEHLRRFGHTLDAVLSLLGDLSYMPKVLQDGRLVDFAGQAVPNDNFFFVRREPKGAIPL